MRSDSYKLPAGKYYIGDPCYVFEDSWDDVLSASDTFQNHEPTEFKGRELWAASTSYGDGVYLDQHGVEYGVDAGLIGAVPVELIENEDHGGEIIDAPEGLTVSCTNGYFEFRFSGNVIGIETNDTDPEYDEGEDQDLNEVY